MAYSICEVKSKSLAWRKQEPPELAQGSDDIFWVNELHKALDAASCYPNGEEVEDWVFGESTLSAVLSFQARAYS